MYGEVSAAVAWASSYRGGAYGAAGLQAAVLGQETFGSGRPLGPGLLNCPQFGALRYVRNGPKRWDATVAGLVAKGLVARVAAQRDGRTYDTATHTATGRTTLCCLGTSSTEG